MTPTRRPPSIGSWAARARTLPGQGNQPLAPTMDGDTKVFDLTVDPIEHQIDAQMPIRSTRSGSTGPGRGRAST